MSHITGIPFNPQDKPLWKGSTELLRSCWPGLSCQKQGDYSSDLNIYLNIYPFHMNFVNFDDMGLSPAYKHYASLPRNTPLPLMIWRGLISLQWQLPYPMLTHEWGYACFFLSWYDPSMGPSKICMPASSKEEITQNEYCTFSSFLLLFPPNKLLY